MIFEYVFTILVTFLATGAISALFIGRIGLRLDKAGEENNLFMSNFLLIISTIATILTLVSIAFVYRLRNIWYCIEFLIDDDKRVLHVTRRKISKSSIEEVVIPYDKIHTQKILTKGFLFVTKYNGVEILNGSEKVGSLLTDHFTWEDQKLAYRSVLASLEEVQPGKN